MQSILVDLKLAPDELRIILSALSTTIIKMSEANNPELKPVIDENIQLYKGLHLIADAKYPGWLSTNPDLKKILTA